MAVELIECGRHVFEVTWDSDEPLLRKDRRASVRLVSGPPLTDEQWGRVKEAMVRRLIDAGCQVRRVTAIREESE